MRGLAQLLVSEGKSVTGSDVLEAELRDDVTLTGVAWLDEAAAAEAVTACDRLIFTDAVPTDHPVRQAAEQAGVPAHSLYEAVGELAADYTTVVAVAGTHGKSSTTALVGHILEAAGLDPTVLLGASVLAWEGKNSRAGSRDVLVLEADEYREHFLELVASHIVITTIAFDHPDWFADERAVEAAFSQFILQQRAGGNVVALEDVVAAHPLIGWPADVVRVSGAVQQAVPTLPGAHMQENAALAVALTGVLGVERDVALEALQTFGGLGRRLESLGFLGQLEMISDYGHHPTEIAATLAAVQAERGEDAVVVMLEVHTQERLEQFAAEYVAALEQAAGVLLVPAFVPTGREEESAAAAAGVQQLARNLKAAGVSTMVVATYEELPAQLAAIDGKFTVGLAFTAGRLDGVLRRLVAV